MSWIDKNMGSTKISDNDLVQQIIRSYDINQLYWLHGLISGLITGRQNGSDLQTASVKPVSDNTGMNYEPVTVLYATQSGNSRKVVKLLESAAEDRNIAVEVTDMADFNPNHLRKLKYAIIICSTQGEGDPPLAAEDFFGFIHGPKISSLDHLQYAVLALGDRSYINFCKVGRDIDRRLTELGATPIIGIGECDVDYRVVAAKWITELVGRLEKIVQTGDLATKAHVAGVQKKPAIQEEYFTRMTPGYLKVTESINLNGRGSKKITTHIEIMDETGRLKYQPGDSLGIYFQNSPQLVTALLNQLNIAEDSMVKNGSDQKIPVFDFLINYAELSLLTKDALEKYNRLKPNEELESLISDTSELSRYIYGRDLLDLVTEYPVSLTAEMLAGITGKMQPRLYSIASSPNYNEGEAHLTVAALTFEFNNRRKYGACSSYVCRNLEIGRQIKSFISENESFRLPGGDSDIIMIGPGTGVAPFRAFLQERELTGATGKNWLFFGDRHFTTDFLYQTEWQLWKKKKLLTKIDVAFSRDYAQKVYVQHRMVEHSRELFDWISNGAHIYICGDKSRMAGDVNQTLLSILKKEGNMSDERSLEYMKNLKKQRRYHEDVY